jgi:aminoglycoside/choline kinase family phosphotransferase
MLIGQAQGLSSDEYQRLKACGRAFERMCAELACLGIPASLHHDDFHDGNLFLQNGRVRFTDWGESAVTHPFFTLVVLLRGAGNSLELAPEAPELAQLRDWYLGEWADFAPLAELRSVAALAGQVGLVNRALTWHRVISNLPESLKAGYAMAVPAYLQEFINAWK